MSGCTKALQAHLDGGFLVEHNEEEHGPLEWLFYGQYIEKPGQPGCYRIVGNFKPLNDRIKKDCYDIMTPDSIWRKVDNSSNNQIANSKNTMKIMAIALPTSEGTKYYHFKTAGMGCSNSRPVWCQASDNVLNDVADVEKGVDDCIVQGKNKQELVPKLRRFFEAARKGNMKFSRKKIQLGPQVECGGYLITKKGIVALPRKVASIMNFAEPRY